jgi:hypothetical protein
MAATPEQVIEVLESVDDVLSTAAETLKRVQEQPYGPAAAGDTRTVAGQACVLFAEGDTEKARALWRQIAGDLGGYMPSAAAIALIRASRAKDIVLPDEAPEIS